MKAIHVIAAVLISFATACGSSTDDAISTAPIDAERSAEVGTATASVQDDDVNGGDEPTADETKNEPVPAADGGTDAPSGTEDDGEPDGEAATEFGNSGLLARASAATVEASTARFEGRMEVAAEPGSSFALTVDGSYDLERDAFNVTVDLSGLAALAASTAEPSTADADLMASMFAEPMQLRVIGDTAWVRVGLLAAMFGAVTEDGDSAWIEAETDDTASMTDQFGVAAPQSPTGLLETLADLDATVTNLGRETIRGTETTHFLAVIDLEAVAADLPAEERAALEAELPGGISGEFPLELWLDDNDLLRRLVVEIDDFESMGLGGESDDIGSMIVEFEVFDVGEPVAIEAPPADQVISSDDLGFGLDDF